MKPKRAVPVVVLGVVAGIALTGCAGPLALDQDHDTFCVPIPQYNPAAFGVDLPAKLTTPITIVSVELVNPDHIKVVSAHAMPITARLALGMGEYPPSDGLASDWSRSTLAAGAVIKPGQRRQIVLELRDDAGMTGKASGASVTYTAGGIQYTARSYTAIEMKEAAHC